MIFLGGTIYKRVVYPMMGLLASFPLGLFAYAMFKQPTLREKELARRSEVEERERRNGKCLKRTSFCRYGYR